MQIELTRQQAMDLATEIFRQMAADPAADVVVDVADSVQCAECNLLDNAWCDWCGLPPELCRCDDADRVGLPVGAVHVAGANNADRD